MGTGEAHEDEPLSAGAFATWLSDMEAALRRERGSEVPCDGCTACCTSSQFVHIEPDETGALAHIPAELQFPAPRLPAGNVLLGYDEDGRCPMLIDGTCSIYEHRPRACRAYDCRVFPAAGVEPDAEAQPAIARRVRRWRFEHPTEADEVLHEAVRAAARFVRERRDLLPEGAVPPNAASHAVLAIAIHAAFLDGTEPSLDEVRVLLGRRRGAVSETGAPPGR